MPMAGSKQEVLREPRAKRRVPLGVETSCLTESSFGFGIAENISETGILIHVPHPYPLNSKIEIRFSLYVDSAVVVIQTKGKVVWVHPGAMMGIQFIDLLEKYRSAISRFVEGS